MKRSSSHLMMNEIELMSAKRMIREVVKWSPTDLRDLKEPKSGIDGQSTYVYAIIYNNNNTSLLTINVSKRSSVKNLMMN